MRLEDHPVDSNDYRRAKELRQQLSPYEQKLWFCLRQASCGKKIKFRFQYPIHPYFVDFICMKAKLIIELDGESHDARQEYDAKRDAYLRKQGYTVVRYSNQQAMEDIMGLAETIVMHAEKMLSSRDNNLEKALPLP